MKILEIKSLVKIYPSPFLRKKKKAVDNLNLKINEGEIFGLLGPNGAGKTTTLKIIVGLLRPTSGAVTLFENLQPEEAREKIGFLPENPSFYRHLTGRELMEFFCSLYGIENGREEIDRVIQMVGMRDDINRKISEYSRGMIQRIGFAQAIMGEREFIILDEPLSGLDPTGRRELKDLILKIQERGKTILFSSHILSDVEAICNRVGIMLNGGIKRIGYIDEIMESETKYIEFEIGNLEKTEFLREFGEIRKEKNTIYLKTEEIQSREEIIKEILSNNGSILSIKPLKQSLEESFIKVVDSR